MNLFPSTRTLMCILLGMLCLTGPAILRAGEPTLVYLVRHAEKVDASRDADLSARGLVRAEALVDQFAQIDIDLFLASEFQRTRKTLAPLATAKKRDIEVVPAAQPDQLVARVRAHPGAVIMVAGHSNTLPDLIARLGGPEITIADDAYRDLFLLVLHENGATLQNFQREP